MNRRRILRIAWRRTLRRTALGHGSRMRQRRRRVSRTAVHQTLLLGCKLLGLHSLSTLITRRLSRWSITRLPSIHARPSRRRIRTRLKLALIRPRRRLQVLQFATHGLDPLGHLGQLVSFLGLAGRALGDDAVLVLLDALDAAAERVVGVGVARPFSGTALFACAGALFFCRSGGGGVV